MLSFLVRGGREQAWKFIDATRMISITANLGDVKTTITHPATTTHRQLTEDEQRRVGVAPEAIRLSVGIEDIEDILADLDQALAAT